MLHLDLYPSHTASAVVVHASPDNDRTLRRITFSLDDHFEFFNPKRSIPRAFPCHLGSDTVRADPRITCSPCTERSDNGNIIRPVNLHAAHRRFHSAAYPVQPGPEAIYSGVPLHRQQKYLAICLRFSAGQSAGVTAAFRLK